MKTVLFLFASMFMCFSVSAQESLDTKLSRCASLCFARLIAKPNQPNEHIRVYSITLRDCKLTEHELDAISAATDTLQINVLGVEDLSQFEDIPAVQRGAKNYVRARLYEIKFSVYGQPIKFSSVLTNLLESGYTIKIPTNLALDEIFIPECESTRFSEMLDDVCRRHNLRWKLTLNGFALEIK